MTKRLPAQPTPIPALCSSRSKKREKFEYVDDPIYKDLSAATRHDKSLFLCCDETVGVDRLTSVADRGYAEHAHFNLGDLVDLPDGPDGEMDIEGLDVDGDWLWIVGSHWLKRDKPESGTRHG